MKNSAQQTSQPQRRRTPAGRIGRIAAVIAIFVVTSIAWLIFGVVMSERSSSQRNDLYGAVSELWGSPQTQQAPTFTFEHVTVGEEVSTEEKDGEVRVVRKKVSTTNHDPQDTDSTRINVALGLDQRLKGLVWYSLYDLEFNGAWTYTHTPDKPGTLALAFMFPDQSGLYDGFKFVVDGTDHGAELKPESGTVTYRMPVEPGQKVDLQIAYATRGLEQWRYQPSNGVSNLEDFRFQMVTDFDDIDFPGGTMSPSSKQATDGGWTLDWSFDRVVTGRGVGMVVPQPIQPGELAASLSVSAPISLFFFFLVIFVLAALRGIDIHPINTVFIAAAFFAFHILFGYVVDHLAVIPAFALSSFVSIVLVLSYMRLVVSARFAFLEAGVAQVIYLVGFSLAHFWDGFTGLTVTVLSIATLFLLMQLTGRIQWSNLFAAERSASQGGRFAGDAESAVGGQ